MAIFKFIRLAHINEHRALRLLLTCFRRRHFSHTRLGIRRKLIKSRTHGNAFEIYLVARLKMNCLTQRRRGRERSILPRDLCASA